MDTNVFLKKYNTDIIEVEVKNAVAVKKYD